MVGSLASLVGLTLGAFAIGTGDRAHEQCREPGPDAGEGVVHPASLDEK